MSRDFQTLAWRGGTDGHLVLLDQTRLPAGDGLFGVPHGRRRVASDTAAVRSAAHRRLASRRPTVFVLVCKVDAALTTFAITWRHRGRRL